MVEQVKVIISEVQKGFYYIYGDIGRSFDEMDGELIGKNCTYTFTS